MIRGFRNRITNICYLYENTELIVNVINMFRLGMGAYANRRKFVTGFEDAPK